jgi:luciferase family oxidoreductase group 1
MSVRLSVLDLAFVGTGQSPADAFDASVRLARSAELHGFTRVWYAEHHNMPDIASTATAVLVEHIASRTERIRVGAGGVMLPNHSPLVIAEQFGMLAALHPGRIDLGLGRAPGGDAETLRALRRDASSAESFPHDVVELQGYLRDRSVVPGVQSYPLPGSTCPLYILDRRLRCAARGGARAPYAFASHFAPAALHPAVEAYRERFTPSDACDEPYVIVGANVVAADDEAEARETFQRVLRTRVRRFVARAVSSSDEEIDAFLGTPNGHQIRDMLRYTAVGRAEQVGDWLDELAVSTGADEIMLAFQADSVEARLRSLDLTAGSGALAPAVAWAATTTPDDNHPQGHSRAPKATLSGNLVQLCADSVPGSHPTAHDDAPHAAAAPRRWISPSAGLSAGSRRPARSDALRRGLRRGPESCSSA